MSVENFQNLLMAQAIDKKIAVHLENIRQEESRIQHIQTLRARRIAELEDATVELKKCKQSIRTQEVLLAKIETQIERNKEHAKNVTSDNQLKAIEHEEISFARNKDEIEKELYMHLEKEESLNHVIQEATTFLEGSEISQKEIIKEVEETVKKEKEQIATEEGRVANMLSLVPEEYRNAFLHTNKKLRFNKPVVFLDGVHCSICRMQHDRMTVQRVEESHHLEFCSGCQRILAPLNAQN